LSDRSGAPDRKCALEAAGVPIAWGKTKGQQMRIAMAMVFDTYGCLAQMESGVYGHVIEKKDPGQSVCRGGSRDGRKSRPPFDTGTVYVVANEHGDLQYSPAPVS
jgi:hypothetical protein